MPFDLDWKGDDIPQQLEEPFVEANQILGRAFTREITTNKWKWPTDPSPRDAVDLGQLRDSYNGKPGREGSDVVFDHAWTAEYAMAVHEGAEFKPNSVWGRIWIAIHGRPVMPGRPWTEKPLKDGVAQKAFDKLVKARLK